VAPKSSADNEKAVEDQVDAPVDQVQQDVDTSAESSTAEQGEKGDMLSAVKAALEPKEKSPASDEPGSKSDDPLAADAKKEGDAAAGESDDLTEEDLARLKPKTRKRIETLTAEVRDRDTKLAEISPKAENFEKIQRFVDEAGLSKDDVNQGFDVMRNLKNDPLKAYEQLKPIFAQLQQIAGEVLPPDLQTEVDQGRLTEAHARELTLARSRAAVNGQRLERVETTTRAERERQEFEQTVDGVAKAVTAWENSTSKGDPDWKLKQPRIQELVELEIMRKQRSQPDYFPTKEEAIEMSKKALTAVETELKRFAPQRRSMTTPASDAGSSRSVAAPKNMLEAVKIGLAKAG
jgi:hypothetical protein